MKLLARQLQALRPDVPGEMSPSSVSLDRADIERLQALGDLTTGEEVFPQAGPSPDPKDMLPLLTRLQLLLSSPRRLERLPLWMRVLAWASGDSRASSPAALIRELERLAADHPDFSPVQWYLAELYRRENRPEEARQASERLKRLIESASENQ
jgi:hypothetical protein